MGPKRRGVGPQASTSNEKEQSNGDDRLGETVEIGIKDGLVNEAEPKFVGFVPASQFEHHAMPVSQPGAAVGDTDTGDVPKTKRRKITMDIEQCEEFANSSEGAMALTNPQLVPKSSKDPSRGLYPRLPLMSSQSDFVTAKAHMAGNRLLPSQQALGRNEPHNPTDNAVKKREFPDRKKFKPMQSNTLNNYFAKSSARKPTGSSQGLSEDGGAGSFCIHLQSSPPSSQSLLQRSKTNCYSPIKKMEGTTSLYVNASDNSSQSSSQSVKSSAISCGSQLPSSPPLSQSSQRSKTNCYSPIKKMEGTSSIYVNDTSQSSSSRSAKSTMSTSSASSSANYNHTFVNAGQKQLQKSAPGISKKLFTKSRSGSKSKKKPEPRFNRNNSFLYDTNLATPLPFRMPKDTVEGDKYGLMGGGGGDFPEEPINYFEYLPFEILENILCQLPMMDLLLNVNRVCLQWYETISAEDFVPWKKRYFAIKMKQSDAVEVVITAMNKNDMSTKEDYLKGLISYMKSFKPVTATNIDWCLKKHHLYPAALALLQERLKGCLSSNGEPNPWSMVAAVVVLSGTVGDITEILDCMLGPQSRCTASEVIECLYCVASFLLIWKRMFPHYMWNGLHYRLYYALYLFENESSTTAAELSNAFNHVKQGQQSLLKYSKGSAQVQMTHEQLHICKYNVQDGDCVRIVAFAGTGKTTTLVRYTQLRPNVKFLMVVYNKSVREHAVRTFPKNVTCTTGHSLGYKYIGWKYSQNNKLGANLKITDVLQHFTARKKESLYVQAKFIVDTVNAYLSSADPIPQAHHVPSYKQDDNGNKTAIDDDWKQFYANEAKRIWDMMRDFNDDRMKNTHDGYLKVWQLAKKKFPRSQYDVILIDEAQDLTPAIADALLSQSQGKILVGDPHQQIYAFRGAVNSMQQVCATHTFYLTQSFRFGPEIASVAAMCLEVLKKEERKTLVGNGIPGGISGEKDGQICIITRCNYTLFNEAVKKCSYSEEPIKIAFVGGIEAFGFDMIMDIYALMLSPEDRVKEKREIRNYLVRKFSNLAELDKYATKTMDAELLGKIKIVKTYAHQLPGHINRIKQKSTNLPETANYLFSTAHKSKGLEFSTVRLTDDFDPRPPPPGRQLTQAEIDENNILYVAVTRAKKQLQLSRSIYALLKKFGGMFLQPVHTQQLIEEKAEFVCFHTDQSFEPNAITLRKQKVTLAEGQVPRHGLIRPQVITEDLPELHQLFGSLKDERTDDANERDVVDEDMVDDVLDMQPMFVFNAMHRLEDIDGL